MCGDVPAGDAPIAAAGESAVSAAMAEQQTWDERYQGATYAFGTEANAWLRQQAHRFHAGQRVLCVADGEGRNSVWLAGLGLTVQAFDVSPVGVAKAQALAQQAGVQVEFEVADCRHWHWPLQTYDWVVAIFIQFADPDMRQAMFAKMRQCLRPGGQLLLLGYSQAQLALTSGGPRVPSHLYSVDGLRQELDGWELLSLEAFEAVLSEGPRHQGLAALVSCVARQP